MAHQSPLNRGYAHRIPALRSTATRRWHAGFGWGLGVALAVLLALGGCAATPAVAQPGRSAPTFMDITLIALESNCFGCASSSTLVLRSDGTATFTVTGNARLGTASTSTKAPLRRQDFDALARLAVSGGFFALNDSYEDPQLQDGAWSTTRVVRGGQDKTVFARDEAGPANLKAVQAAIVALQSKLGFQPR